MLRNPFSSTTVTTPILSPATDFTVTMSSYLQRLNSLAARIAEHSDSEEEDRFVQLLKDVAAVVREADASGTPELPDIVEKAGGIFNDAINWAYSDGEFDFLPSYAHAPGAPPVEDPLHGIGVGAYVGRC